MKSVLLTGIVCGAVLAAVASTASAGPLSCTGVCDNTQEGDVNEINGALFVTNDAKGSVGTGTFPAFVKVHDGSSKTVEDGYNTFASGGPFLDTKKAPLRMPTVANLGQVGWTGTNLVVGGTGYYQFNLDINEEKNVADKWLSLDQVEVCLSTSNSLAPANTELWSGCGGLGASRVYAMDLGGASDPDNTVLMDFSINEGSGNGIDLFLLIPVGSFSTIVGSGNPADYYIYLYSHFGAHGKDQTRIVETKEKVTGGTNNPTITYEYTYANFGQSDGGEEWAYRACPPGATGCTPPPACAQGEICTTSVPLPGSLALLGAGLVGLAGARRVRRSLYA